MKYALVASLFLSLGALQVRAQDQHVVFEVVAGKLKEGGDMEAQRKADKAVEALVSKLPGFISRETAAGDGGEWFVIVRWASLKDAENAAAVFMRSEEAKASMLDPNSILFKHYIKEQ
jgi:heme-degrading monooxygenase HmoA